MKTARELLSEFDEKQEAPARDQTARELLEKFDESARIADLPMLEQLGRQLGLTVRHVTEGALSAGTLFADPLNALINQGLEASGSEYRLMPASEAVSEVLTDAGLPEPNGGLEEGVAAASRAVSGAAVPLGWAQSVKGVDDVTSGVASLLAQAPEAQAIGAATGGAAADIARQQGASPLAQTAAGMGGGFFGGGATIGTLGSMRGSSRGVRAAAAPFTRSGQERIAGEVLRDQASDSVAAAEALDAATEIVPGSVQTTGPASGDVGLLSLQKGVAQQNRTEFGERLSEQNLARQEALDSVSGNKADVKAAKQARDAETSPMRDASFANSSDADVSPVISKIDEILAGPKGKRTAVGEALRQVRNDIEGETDPETLYSIRQNIGDMMSGKVKGEKANFRLARSQLIEVREQLDNAIDAVAPGFKAYLERYRSLSRPINQMEVMQEIRRRSRLAAPDPTTGRDFLSQAKFRNRLEKAAVDGDLEKLTPEQRATLEAVATDLDLASAINSSLLRTPGSDTFQNISSATLLNAMVGRTATDVHPIVQTLLRPINWMYKYPDAKVGEILKEAMLQPEIASKLLKRATPKNMRSLSIELRRVARGLGLGATESQASKREQQQR
jgi:hypothetical protein